jgi:hypothetical protein
MSCRAVPVVKPSHRPPFAPALAFALVALAFAAPGAHALDAAPGSMPTSAHAPTYKAGAHAHGPLADFAGVAVSPGVREVANWSFYTRDNQGRSVVILDKQAATVYVFNRAGRMVSTAPVLLGLTVGDGTAPGVGDKPIEEVRDDEKTTPAGRFLAQPGEDDSGTDVVWIDYDAAVAMHRVIDKVRAERRPERLASPDPRERRISFGCINLPIPFYEQVLAPTVRRTGAIVYVLPETQPASQVFGSWDVTDPNARPPRVPAGHAAPATAPAPQLREAQARFGVDAMPVR